MVRTDSHLYGFRGANGVWLDEALGVRETVKRTQTTDYGAVFVTNERLVGFASLLGDFSSKTLDTHEHITRLDNENGLVIITTSNRTLVFGSRLSGWEESSDASAKSTQTWACGKSTASGTCYLTGMSRSGLQPRRFE